MIVFTNEKVMQNEDERINCRLLLILFIYFRIPDSFFPYSFASNVAALKKEKRLVHKITKQEKVYGHLRNDNQRSRQKNSRHIVVVISQGQMIGSFAFM